MRTKAKAQRGMWSYVSDEERIPADHPLRRMRSIVDPILLEMSPQLSAMYPATGRGSVPPEYLLRALLIQMFYSIRSERQLAEQLQYNILFRWFVGLRMDDPAWHATTFSKNRQRLIDANIAREFFARVVAHAQSKALMSSEHFTVDGTMLEAAASHKSVISRDDDDPPAAGGNGRNEAVDFHDQSRSNATHVSTTDPDARLYRKSQNTAAKLAYLGHALTENRNGLIVDARVSFATGFGERAAAIAMIARLRNSGTKTLGADKGYDSSAFVNMLNEFDVTPHVAQHKTNRRSAVPESVARTEEYAMSQRRRKLVEETFGWMKSFGLLRKLRHRGRRKVDWIFTFAAAMYNLIRITKLTAISM